MRPHEFPPTLARAARSGAIALVLALASCGGDGGGGAVARVGDVEITVDEAAEYMMQTNRSASVAAVQRAVDDLVDLELLRQRALDQHVFSAAESLQIRELEEIALINQFREDVVWATVDVDEAELRRWYEENVSEEARARHILIRVSPTAPEEDKAAARAKADSLLEAARGGADFAEMAREHSEDPGSGPGGGMLDWFGRGQMVETFENAVFSTPGGELVDEVVESPFGFHVIRVEERRRRPFEDLREEIEDQLEGPGRQQAEEAYVTRLMETSAIDFAEQNVDFLLELVRENREPTVEEAARPLATYAGGQLTVGEIYDLFRVLPEANRRSIAGLDQGQMISALASVVRQRLLVLHAERENVVLDTVRQRMFDEQVDALFMESYLRGVAERSLEVSDAEAAVYYEEHREFYQGRPFEEVADQIREVLRMQRMQALSAPDAQRQLVEAVADSMAERVEVEVYSDRFDDVLERLREMYAEAGRDVPDEDPPPGGASGTPASPPPAAVPPAGGAESPVEGDDE
ncbi:MAG TPA: peptidylprolyl isomerase [Gemmatimonadota bacterium]|nr:peptidylprolyl isomerase [Gemmatimonadota bacterium]